MAPFGIVWLMAAVDRLGGGGVERPDVDKEISRTEATNIGRQAEDDAAGTDSAATSYVISSRGSGNVPEQLETIVRIFRSNK